MDLRRNYPIYEKAVKAFSDSARVEEMGELLNKCAMGYFGNYMPSIYAF